MTYEQFVLVVCISIGISIITVLVWEIICRINLKREKKREVERTQRRNSIAWQKYHDVTDGQNDGRLPEFMVRVEFERYIEVMARRGFNGHHDCIGLLRKDVNGNYGTGWVQDAWSGWRDCAKRYGVMEN